MLAELEPQNLYGQESYVKLSFVARTKDDKNYVNMIRFIKDRFGRGRTVFDRMKFTLYREQYLYPSNNIYGTL